MSWIDERLAEKNARKEKEQSIRDSAETIFNDMWSYIVGDVEEAKKNGFAVSTNGTPLDHIVRFPVEANPSGEQRREIHFKLNLDQYSIVVSGEVTMKFVLDACPDGSVCPKDEQGKQVSYKEAAKKILDPFLFPELQRGK